MHLTHYKQELSLQLPDSDLVQNPLQNLKQKLIIRHLLFVISDNNLYCSLLFSDAKTLTGKFITKDNNKIKTKNFFIIPPF